MSASYCSRSSALMDGTLSAARTAGGRARPLSGLALFADLGRLTDAVAQVIELGAADVTPADDLDLGDGRRVERERALDAHAVAHLPHLERLADAGARAADDDALEDLDALLGPLDHAHMDLERVAGREVGDVGAQAGLVDEIGGIHRAVAPGEARDGRTGDAIRAGEPNTKPSIVRVGSRAGRAGAVGEPELDQQRAVGVRQPAPRLHEVRAAVQRAADGLGPAPARHPAVVAGTQHLGN